MTNQNSQAPGAPGIYPKWTSSSKSGIGKSLNPSSAVAFTISHGIINEVYYPSEDIACVRDMEFIITDGSTYFSEEKRDTDHRIKMINPGIPAYEIKNTARDGSFQITKEIITDPYRNTVLQRISFQQNDKNTSYRLYALLAPHLNNQGYNNNGWIDEYKGVQMLFAQNEGITLALACSSNWLKRSVRYVGNSDGWMDLNKHKKMEWEYASAPNGNIALTGEIDISQKKEFILALSFGRTPAEAANHARASLLDGFDSAHNTYVAEWEAWQKTLKKLNAKNFEISATILRLHESKKFPDGIIASLSIPWGESKSDAHKGGYHLVWPRDLVESSGGFIALESKDDSMRILNYLMSTQNEDGSWPQNMWLQGEHHWDGIQMDQIALPILEIAKAYEMNAIDKDRMERYWPLAKKAIIFLLKNGPNTPEDRWEEEQGYTPFTIAAQIAGLLAAADLSEINGDKNLASYCRETADNWNDSIETWTYVTGTSLAIKHNVEGYYIRINPFKDISAQDLGNRTINLKNHNNDDGKIKINELVSVDALALVRFGIRDANDPKILNTLKVIDAVLKVETPNGPCWHRYNNDGYGEHENGNPYDGAGIGRAWPLLTGERAHYEIAAGNLKGAKVLLECMDAFSNNGLIPEQIWDTEDIPEKGLYFGKHTGSAMPLTWAHAEYLKLCASLDKGKIIDMPSYTRERYVEKKSPCPFEVWSFDNPIKTLNPSKNLRIEVMASAIITWTDDSWQTKQTINTTDLSIGIFIADIEIGNKKAEKIEFTFYWEASNSWENKNYVVDLNNELTSKYV